ncbi:MAG: DUF11 domain-containing protein [Bacteroidota bacterium]|nr:DUF11 domain-containing protein [Bacteroidota bacterium]
MKPRDVQRAMRTFLFRMLLKIFFVALPVANSLFAAGTPAGTVITSRAIVRYTSSTGGHYTVTSEVQMIVEQIAAANLTPASQRTTAHVGNFTVFPLTLINSGNGTDNFTFNSTSSTGRDVAVFKDADGSGSLTQQDTLAGRVTSSGALAEDSTMKIFVRITVPDDEALNNQIDNTSFTAVSKFDTIRSAVASLHSTVHSPIIHLQSALSVDNPSPTVPGPVTFALSFTNTGSDSATHLVVTEKLDSRFSFVSATGGGVLTGTDSVVWNSGSLGAGASLAVSFTVNLATNIPTGTVISDSMNVAFNDGTLRRSKASNSVSLSVISAHEIVSVSPQSASIAKEPLDTVVYGMMIKNIGASSDVIEVSSASSRALVWKFYRDANLNGVLDASDLLLTNTNGFAGVDLGSVASGDSVHVLAMTTLPMVSVDQTTDTTTFTFTPVSRPEKFRSSTGITSINIPVISLQLSYFPAVPQLPAGSEVHYSIQYSNTGHASASDFQISDPVPDSAEYVANSVLWTTGGQSFSFNDNEGPVLISESASRNKIVNFTVGALPPATTGKVEFRAKIK